MAEKVLLKRASGEIAEFGSTDTIPAANLPAVSVISPSTINADQDNYNPTGWADADTVRLAFDTGGRAITGLAAWTNTKSKTLINTTGNFGYLACEHPDSTAGNRIVGASDHIISPYGSLIVEYDSTSSRVRVVKNSFEFSNLSTTPRAFYLESAGATLGGDWGDVGFNQGSGANGTLPAVSGLPGGWELNTQASTTGNACIYFAKSMLQPTLFGSAHIISSSLIFVGTLSDASNTYTISVGIATSPSSLTLAQNNSATIQYTHGTNSGKFLGVLRNNAGAQSTADLGITVAANTPYLLTVCFDKAISEARFYIDGVMCGRVTGSMPNAVAVGHRIIITKTAGTTQRNIVIPSMQFSSIS